MRILLLIIKFNDDVYKVFINELQDDKKHFQYDNVYNICLSTCFRRKLCQER
jgi:hypothetical protein